MHFSTLLAAAATIGLALAAPAEKKSKRNTKLKFFGVNESGAEFGSTNIPGVYGTDYTWYNLTTIDVRCPIVLVMTMNSF